MTGLATLVCQLYALPESVQVAPCLAPPRATSHAALKVPPTT